MLICKVINHNMVMAQDQNNQMVILQGRGIGFDKKKGDPIEPSKVERMFVSNDKNEMKHYQEFFAALPPEYWDVSEQVMDYAMKTCNMNVSGKIMLPLCDHILGAVERYKNGVVLKNPMLWETRRFYPTEYQIGEYALDVIEKRFGIRMEPDEAAFLAFHFVYAQAGCSDESVQMITEIIRNVTEIVETCFQTKLDVESWDYQRFITHIKFFARRMLGGKQYEDSDEEWYSILKSQYPVAYRCAVKVADFIHDRYFYELNKEELFYLMVHIEKITRNAV